VLPFQFEGGAMDRQIKVRLKADLTRYVTGLVPGVEGVTVGRRGIWSRGSDCFITVQFLGKTTLDVLWSSLEIIDDEYLKEAEASASKHMEELKTATDIVRHLGPRGGFQCLSFTYRTEEGITTHTSIGFRKEAERIISYFSQNGILVKDVIRR
jgi:hypothetical protein